MMETLSQEFGRETTASTTKSTRRSRLEIHLDILDTISRGDQRPTRIMFSANLAWMALQEALRSLKSSGLITKVVHNHRSLYSVTAKGHSVLDDYRSVRKTLLRDQLIELSSNKLKGLILDSVERGLIVDSVERGLNNVLEKGQSFVYHRINENFGIKKEDIPDKPEDFVRALREIFKGGSVIIERAIATEMSNVMESKPEGVPFDKTSNCLKILEAS